MKGTNKISFILVALIIYLHGGEGASLRSTGEDTPLIIPLEYLGSFEHTTQGRIKRNVGASSTSHYFKSQNAAAYSTARQDCKNFLGPDASLLGIETQEELEQVIDFLRSSDDTGSSYWVGAGYDPSRGTFVWESGTELDSSAPWDDGYPDTRTPVTKVVARTVGDVKLRTQFSTISTRYICELSVGPPETTTTEATTTSSSTTTEDPVTEDPVTEDPTTSIP